MSDHDSGVECAGEDSNTEIFNQNLPNASYDDHDDEMNDDDNGDDNEGDEINDNPVVLRQNQVQEQENDTSDVNPNTDYNHNKDNENELFKELSPNALMNFFDILKTSQHSPRNEQIMMMAMHNTPCQPTSENMFSLPSSSSSSSSSSSLSFSVFNPGSTSMNSADNLFRMRTFSNDETTMDKHEIFPSLSPDVMNPIITNVNQNGFNSTLNQQNSNSLWNFHLQYNGQQHAFVPKMMRAKKIWRHRNFNRQYSTQQHEEKMLRIAANDGDFKLVQRLITCRHVYVNASDERRRTALHFAVVCSHKDIVRFLLVNGADPNLRDVVGNTPLHLAVCSSKPDMVTLLVKNGAVCTIKDNNGRTPINLAQSKLLYISKSLERRTANSIDSNSPTSHYQQKLDSSTEKLKMEAAIILVMLQIYFDKYEFDNEKRANMNVLKNRVEASQTPQEIENGVNDLLHCLQEWTL